MSDAPASSSQIAVSAGTGPGAEGTRLLAGPPRVLESRRFGRLEVSPDRLVIFPTGLLGFEEFHEYLRVAPETLHPITFLVSCDDPEVAFPLLPANLCLAGYAPTFPPEALTEVGSGPGNPLGVYAIVTLAADTGTLHANLRGPLLINHATRIGRQVVLHESSYDLRHLVSAD